MAWKRKAKGDGAESQEAILKAAEAAVNVRLAEEEALELERLEEQRKRKAAIRKKGLVALKESKKGGVAGMEMGE
jgi:hypothetical protein